MYSVFLLFIASTLILYERTKTLEFEDEYREQNLK